MVWTHFYFVIDDDLKVKSSVEMRVDGCVEGVLELEVLV
jgi:hypothetical protein